MIKIEPFNPSDFDLLISWIDNEELLVTIAGRVFSYPLTNEQLQNYLQLESSYSFTIVDAEQNIKIGHAEIILSGEDTFKIDKLIIGDKSNRGKGIGQEVINGLLEYSFTKLDAKTIELNVFDWNIAGIRCYEKCGFIINPNKQASIQIGDKTWTALNMTIGKQDWMNRKEANNKSIAAGGTGH
jgi:RimJ/RimL family protein N-acetyltransferase